MDYRGYDYVVVRIGRAVFLRFCLKQVGCFRARFHIAMRRSVHATSGGRQKALA